MKKLVFVALLSALSGVVMAQDPDSVVVNISAPQLTVQGIANARAMGADEFEKFKRTYELSNGDTLSLFNRNNINYAKVGEGAWHSIVATGPNSFVSKDRLLKMEINLHDDDTVSGEVIMPASPKSIASNDRADGGFVKVSFR